VPSSIQVLHADNLDLPWLIHGFSTRLGGFSQAYGGHALNLGYTHDDSRDLVSRNRAAFFRALGAPGWPLVSVRQIHSDLIWPVTAAGPRPPEFTTAYDAQRATRNGKRETPFAHAGDALLTATPGLLLSIRTADCLPILLADPRRRAVGIVHAGWRPTLRRIAEKAVGEMRRWFGSRPQDLRAAIGPGIHACCYEVGEEVREQFHSQFAYAGALFTETKDSDDIHARYPLLFLVQRAPGHIEPNLPVKIRLDLVDANRRQLLDAGLRPRHLSASPLCTACRTDLLFSHRAERGLTGRLMAVIAIKP
jgi:YfiH family protein